MTTNSPSRTSDNEDAPVNNTDGDLISERWMMRLRAGVALGTVGKQSKGHSRPVSSPLCYVPGQS